MYQEPDKTAKSAGFVPRRTPGRYWFWLLVILIGGLWPIAFFAFGIWIQETMPSCVVSTGGGSSCVIGDMDYAPLLTGLAWTAP